MIVLTAIHVAAGLAAIVLGMIVVLVRKGSMLHARFGHWFVVSMLVVGVSGIVDAALNPELDIALTASGVVLTYLVTTGWVAARKRSPVANSFERWACAAILTLAMAFAGAGVAAASSPGGVFFAVPVAVYAGIAAVCGIAGGLDIAMIRRGKSTAKQRIARHLWRMCFAFLMTTSFLFLGQQDEMPLAVRGAPIMYPLALAPLAVMVFWLARLRFGTALRDLGRATQATQRSRNTIRQVRLKYSVKEKSHT